MSRPRAATSVATSRSTSPRLERVQRLQALVLALVAVQRGGLQAVALERARQPRAAELAVDEHEAPGESSRWRRICLHRAPLVVVGHAVEMLLDGGGRGVGPRHLDRDRVLQVAVGQPPDLGREGGREQQRLPLLGQVRQDALQVGQEADVEHAVGLVEHHVLDLVEHRVLGLDVVEQPPRRGDQHLDAALQLSGLRLHVDAAEHHRAAQLGVLGVELDLLAPPGRPVRAWAQHQRAHRVPRRRRAGVLVLSIFCSSGSEKAAVLPVPVWAAPITSRPVSTTGIAWAWIGVIDS